MNISEQNSTIHQGRNIKRFREMLGIKQEAFASELGEDWSQKKVSLLETKNVIEPEILKQVSAVLKIPVEAFQNFDEDQAVNIISNTFSDFKDNSSAINYCPTFNPLEKLMDAIEENKKLYERLILSEKEKVEILERLRLGK